jgi:hypothetical protein
MNGREKTIVVLMALVVMYGGYSLFFSSSAKTPQISTSKETDVAEVGQFATQIKDTLKQDESSTAVDVYVIQQATQPWENDPFLKSELKEKSRAREAEEETVIMGNDGLIYSGYLQVGTTKLAIINGIEYEKGEVLPDQGGYAVIDIFPNKVILGAGERNKKIIIPLIEDLQGEL